MKLSRGHFKTLFDRTGRHGSPRARELKTRDRARDTTKNACVTGERNACVTLSNPTATPLPALVPMAPSQEDASKEGEDITSSTFLSTDGIPSTITIHERSDQSTIVQFTAGHHFNDKTTLTQQNFGWDPKSQTYVRIWAHPTSLSSLLKTHAIEPLYIMPDNNDAESYRGHCLLTPRCFMPHGPWSNINSVLSRKGFKWSKEKRAWFKKMKIVDYKNDIIAFLKQAPLRITHHGTEQVLDAKQSIKKVLEEQKNFNLQYEHQQAEFIRKRDELSYRLHLAHNDPDYQRASYSYGQHIKHLAAQGIYDYPPPPELPPFPRGR